jgi:phosphoglycolate phosphatase
MVLCKTKLAVLKLLLRCSQMIFVEHRFFSSYFSSGVFVNRYQCVILDWDGTLVDSLQGIVSALRDAAIQMQLPLKTEQQMRDIVGLGLPEAIRALYPELRPTDQQQFRHYYSQNFVQNQTAFAPFLAGVREGIEQMRAAGLRLVVATGKSRLGLDRALAAMQAQDWFDLTRCADETASKPHPLMLQQIVAELNIPVQQCVMVGDTEYDLLMAQAMPMDAIAVNYGAHLNERLLDCAPRLIAQNFSEVTRWVLS